MHWEAETQVQSKKFLLPEIRTSLEGKGFTSEPRMIAAGRVTGASLSTTTL